MILEEIPSPWPERVVQFAQSKKKPSDTTNRQRCTQGFSHLDVGNDDVQVSDYTVFTLPQYTGMSFGSSLA